jgi:hypothetical protein
MVWIAVVYSHADLEENVAVNINVIETFSSNT